MSPTFGAMSVAIQSSQKFEARSQKFEARSFADNKKPAVQIASAGSGGHERA
jgi:hypothetical protein